MDNWQPNPRPEFMTKCKSCGHVGRLFRNPYKEMRCEIAYPVDDCMGELILIRVDELVELTGNPDAEDIVMSLKLLPTHIEVGYERNGLLEWFEPSGKPQEICRFESEGGLVIEEDQ